MKEKHDLFFLDLAISLQQHTMSSVFLKMACFLIYESNSTVFVYHIFCIHSPVDGHLGWFQLAIVRGAAINPDELLSLCSVLT